MLPRISYALMEGVKVSLRPVEPGDAQRAFQLLHGHEPILRWLLWRGPEAVEELENSFRCWEPPLASVPDYLFAIVDLETGLFAGTTGLRFYGVAGGADIGYWLSESLWGRGLGSEAIQLCCSFAFRHLGIPSVTAWAFVGNEASRKALGRSGFSLMRTVLQKTESDGQCYDQWHFVLLREEWLALHSAWQPRAEEIRFAEQA